MRKLLFAAVAAVAAVTAAGTLPAQAQDTSVRVTAAPQVYQLQPQETAAIAGVYQLDNGAVFRMSGKGHRLMAQLGERPMTELIAQDATHFIARDQKMTVDYIPQAFGDLIVLRYPADLARLDAPLVTVQLAAR